MLSCSIGFLHRVFGWVVVLTAAAWFVCAVRMVPHGTIRTAHRTPFLPSLPYVCGSASHNTFELRDCLSLQCSLL